MEAQIIKWETDLSKMPLNLNDVYLCGMIDLELTNHKGRVIYETKLFEPIYECGEKKCLTVDWLETDNNEFKTSDFFTEEPYWGMEKEWNSEHQEDDVKKDPKYRIVAYALIEPYKL